VLALAPDEQPETIVKAMRAGADEFLRLPVDAGALLKVCIKVSALRGATTSGSRGQVWVVYGPKGGVGATTLVANLGLALRAAQRTTALVDLDVHGADLAMFLNLAPAYSLRDIVANYRRLDPVFLQGTMMRHRSGLSLLAAAPPVPSEPPLVLSGEQTLRLLELVDAAHEVTVVDTTAVPTDAVRAALSCADRILLVTELTLPALRACVRAVEWLREDGVDVSETVEVVVNKYANRSWEVAPAEASKTLRLPIRALVPRDEAAVYTAVNSGLGLDEVRGGSAVQRAIAGLANGPGTAADDPSPVLRGFRRFFAVAERRA
jgi:pilus assembly protein CpaE